MCTKPPPEYQANPEHPPNKKTFPTTPYYLLLAPYSLLPTPYSLLPPHSLLAHRLYYIKLEAQIAKTSPKTLYSCHIVIIGIRYKT